MYEDHNNTIMFPYSQFIYLFKYSILQHREATIFCKLYISCNNNVSFCNYEMVSSASLQRHCTENSKQIFPEIFPRSVHLFCCSKKGRPSLGIDKSFTDA